jgi:hypothetical protein
VSRFLAILLAVSGLTILGAPGGLAAAGPTRPLVHLVASSGAVSEGETVRLHGTVRRAVTGTQVRLQRRVGSGWHRAAPLQRVSPSGAFSFTSTPPRGRQVYRVVSVRRGEQLSGHSASVSIRVRWQPLLAMSATPVTEANEHQFVDITASIQDGPAGQEVDVEARPMRSSEPWSTAQIVRPIGQTPFTVRMSRDEGLEYRLRLAPTRLTKVAYSTVVDDATPPFQVEIGSGIVLINVPAGTVISVPVVEGQYVTLTFGYLTGAPMTVTAPSGAPVATDSGPCGCPAVVVRFHAWESGLYEVTLGPPIRSLPSEPLVLYASVPKVVDAQPDVPVNVRGDMPGQIVDVQIPATQGDVFTIQDAGCCGYPSKRELLAPDGSAAPPWLLGFRANLTGEYTYRYTPWAYESVQDAGDVIVRSVIQLKASVSGPAATADVYAGQQVVVDTTLGDGDLDNVAGTASMSTGVYFDADTFEEEGNNPTGHEVLVLTANTAGNVQVSFTAPLNREATIDGDPVVVDTSAYAQRTVDLHFSGTAGQVVLLEYDPGFVFERLTDANGQFVEVAVGRFVVLPETGNYTLRMTGTGGITGAIALSSVSTVSVSDDGTPVTISIADPHQVAAAVITGTPNTHVNATVEQISASLGENAEWDYFDSRGYGRGHDQTPALLYMGDDGKIVGFFWGYAGATGTLRLTVIPQA